ncbi:late embryogenesis abundant protein [Striga asiatica]|uniref:Late embryogenesis abundant protein n=1 Tax=Striga asiatica TaxID=4170 RepID=A0A5A7QI20_STRAF|nr:late embryogenesis abundant protein [Striga asiatica]
MTDRVYPSTKPTANGGPPLPSAAAANGGANPAFPANKAQLYNAGRLPYRPQPPPRRRHTRSCCCCCCLWTTLLILLVLLLAAIAGAVFYILYRPHRPSFSVASLRLSRFNLTDTAITSAFNVTLVARNPNSKIAFSYEQISVRVLSGEVDIADGAFPAFTHGKKNVTTLRTVISSSNTPIGADTDTSRLRSSVRSRNLPIKIELDTKVIAKIGNIKTKKLEIRVSCDGFRVSIPNGRTASVATISDVKCKVDPRIKIIRWTF